MISMLRYNFAKIKINFCSAVSEPHADHNSKIKKWGSPSWFLSYKHLKLKLRVFFTAFTVPMVTSYVRKIATTYLPMIRYLFDTIIVTATDKSL